jgi:hypothetical protein
LGNLNSLQSTIADLKEIVQRNQGVQAEAFTAVRQMEQLIADIERKTLKNASITVVIPTGSAQGIPVI